MAIGALLALAAVIPVVMRFSLSFSGDKLQPVIGLSSFLHFTALIVAGFAIVFELPVALLLAIRCGLVSVETLRKQRPYIVVGLFVFAALLTPPDVVSQLLMGLPGWLLFELTLLIGARLAPKKEEDEESENSEHSEYLVAQEESSSAGSYSYHEETGAPEEPSDPEPEHCVDDAPYRRAARKKRRIRPL